MSITNCYAPTDEAKESQNDKFCSDLLTTNMSIIKRFKSVILGDLNATIGHKCYGHWSSLGPTINIDIETNDNGIRLWSFADQNRHRIKTTQRLIHTRRSGTGFQK